MRLRDLARMITRVTARPTALTYSAAPVAAFLAMGAKPGWDGTGLSVLEVVGIFLGIPIGMFIVISLLFVYVPEWNSERRYRPGLMWTAQPEWFEGPEHPEESADAQPTTGGGGASAGW